MTTPKDQKKRRAGGVDIMLIVGIGLLASVIGVAIGVAEYVMKPAMVGQMDLDEWDEQDTEWEDVMTRYFSIGKRMQSRAWVKKYKNFIVGKPGEEYRFNEEELNAWVHNGARSSGPIEFEKLGLKVFIMEPVFTVEDGLLQIVVPAKVMKRGKLGRFYYVLQGSLERSGDEVVFDTKDMYWGSARIPMGSLIGGNKRVGDFVNRFKKKVVAKPFMKAWSKVKEARIEGHELVLVKR